MNPDELDNVTMEETSTEEVTTEEPSMEETFTEELPVDETPTEEAPAVEPPVDQTPTEEAPGGEQPTLSISADAESVPEGNEGDTTPVTFTISSDRPLERDVTINAGASTVVGDDPNTTRAENFTTAIAAGQQSVQITSELIGDNVQEPNATVSAQLTNAFFTDNSEQLTVTQPTATTIVTDDDGDNTAPPTGDLPNLEISADAESVPEGNEGDTTFVNFTVNVDRPFERDVEVTYSLQETDGNSNFFRGFGVTGIIPAGEQSTQISYDLSGDTLDEPDASITADFSSAFFVDNGEPIEVTTTQPTATTRVIDDDGDDGGTTDGGGTTEDTGVNITADVDVIPEGNEGETTTITYTVDLGQTIERNARLAVDVFDGDGNIETNRIEIPAGEQTFTITDEITGDNEAERSEIFSATIENTNIIDAGNGETLDLARDVNRSTASVVVSDDDGGNDIVYRFFNPGVGVHFYTDDENERQFVRENLDIYDFEGASYRSVDPMTEGAEDVYRFFNESTGVHLYTTDENERDFIIDNNSAFSFEGSAFSAFETEVENSIPIYRFLNPSLGVHFYTPNETERDFVDNELDIYENEGIAYYALPLDGEL